MKMHEKYTGYYSIKIQDSYLRCNYVSDNLWVLYETEIKKYTTLIVDIDFLILVYF